MRIEKRTMNWLPQKSLYEANEAARKKRRAYAQNDIALTSSLASAFTTSRVGITSDQVTLAIKVAAERIQAKANAKLKAAAESLSKTA
jgi:hypothetical protein